MKISNLVGGITILRKYFEGQDGYHIGAEHDVFYVFTTSRPVSSDDVASLVELGWLQENVATKDGEFTAECYDPDESWAAYT